MAILISFTLRKLNNLESLVTINGQFLQIAYYSLMQIYRNKLI